MPNTKQDRARVSKQKHEIRILREKFKTDTSTVKLAMSMAKTPTGRPSKSRKIIEPILAKLIADRYERN